MIIIHVAEITNRVQFTFDLIFKEILKVSYHLTTDKEEFLKSEHPKFSYGKTKLNGSLCFHAVDLLFEKEIRKQPVEFRQWNNLCVFFNVENDKLPFDLFAAAFYLVSRYEEYLPHSRDSHNRYRAEESAAFKGGFLDRPIVNLWAIELKKILKAHFPDLEFPYSGFSFTPTIDIDNAYAYKYKGWLRITSALLERLITFKFKKLTSRLSVHAGYKRDPYDSYERQNHIHKIYNLKPLYFILLGNYGRFDKNLSYKNEKFRDLIRSISQRATVGLHPSYGSNRSEIQLYKEKERLEDILGTIVVKSRQHYLRLQFPDTYRKLIKAGIKEDYSMGYTSKVGFRASTCTPFYFFDLEENNITDLKIFPFAVMDSTLKFYLRFRSKDVIAFLKPMVDEVKQMGGNFIFVFHNESIGNEREWKNWGDIYEKVIKLCLAED
ncbi:MAG: polysaccharide deacetylase family protein [Cytophagaceae bacterium]|nr:polysaccharide deacetylase family protein [Cytophagaceae bacterium]